MVAALCLRDDAWRDDVRELRDAWRGDVSGREAARVQDTAGRLPPRLLPRR